MLRCCVLPAILFSLWIVPTISRAADDQIRNSVVKIHTTQRPPDFLRPWSKGTRETSGSGAIIEGNRILTNAHVVQYASRLYVQGHQSSKREPAEVEFVAHGMDLAIIKVKDEEFFKDRKPIDLAKGLPNLKDTVNAYGYPIGGEQLSITEGIISRIECTSFYYEGFGLRIQVDAALNPGNSGGPAIANGKIIGLVFSGVPDAENIGYLIPAEEIQTFLADIADGKYDGKPRLFDEFQTVENRGLREKLGLGSDKGGMMVTRTKNRDETYPLKSFDVITKIGDYELDRQGQIQVNDDLRLTFHYMVPKLANDGKVSVTLMRDGKESEVEIPVQINREYLIPPLKGSYPSHFVYGPMLFTTASQDLLSRLGGAGRGMLAARKNPLFSRLFDAPSFPGEELVVLGPRLFPHPTSEGYDPQTFAVVSKVNKVPIKSLSHLVETMRDLEDEYVIVELNGTYETLVFRRDELEQTTQEILEDEGIRMQLSSDLEELWEK